MAKARTAKLTRNTKETRIQAELNMMDRENLQSILVSHSLTTC